MALDKHGGDLSSITPDSALPAQVNWQTQVYSASADAINFVDNNPGKIFAWAAVIGTSAAGIYYGRPDYSKAVIQEFEPFAMSRAPALVRTVAARAEAATIGQVKELPLFPKLFLVDERDISKEVVPPFDLKKLAEIRPFDLKSLSADDDIYVDPLASIEKNVKLGKGVQIEFDAVVGADSEIANGAVIEHGVVIGKNVKIQGHPETGFSGAYIGPDSSIGDNVTIAPGAYIGARVHIASGANLGKVNIQDDVVVHENVTAASGVRIGHHAIVRAGCNIMPSADVGNYATIGKMATICPNAFIRDKFFPSTGEVLAAISIGDRSLIGSGARIFKSVLADFRIGPGTTVR